MLKAVEVKAAGILSVRLSVCRILSSSELLRSLRLYSWDGSAEPGRCPVVRPALSVGLWEKKGRFSKGPPHLALDRTQDTFLLHPPTSITEHASSTVLNTLQTS